jgi:hypothetical protein
MWSCNSSKYVVKRRRRGVFGASISSLVLVATANLGTVMIKKYGSSGMDSRISRTAFAGGMLLALTFGVVLPSAAQEKDHRFALASIDQQTKSVLSRSIKVDLQRYVDGKMGRLEDQDAQILVNSVIITPKGELVVDLSRGFLGSTAARVEEDRRDQLKSLYVEVIDPALTADFRNSPVEFTVEGKALEEWGAKDPTLTPKKKVSP